MKAYIKIAYRQVIDAASANDFEKNILREPEIVLNIMNISEEINNYLNNINNLDDNYIYTYNDYLNNYIAYFDFECAMQGVLVQVDSLPSAHRLSWGLIRQAKRYANLHRLLIGRRLRPLF